VSVYALYIPSAHAPHFSIPLEVFASQELASRILKERNATRRSRTFLVGAPRPTAVHTHPVADFHGADATGYFRVFLRRAADPVPGLLDTPDEEWVTDPGGRQGKVVRLPWTRGTERVVVNPRTGLLNVTPRPPRPVVPAVPAPAREVRCADPACPRLFSAPCANIRDFNRLLMEQGWRWRGSVSGQVHYCGDHAG
jgi:hypothetical protein